MALSGLDIYKLLPKTNCKECGFATCLAFAMQLAKKAVSIEKCPYISAESKKTLEASSQPPIKLISIGSGPNKLDIGNETVLFRHEEKFHKPCGIGGILSSELTDADIRSGLQKINGLKFERVGQDLEVNLVAIKQVGAAKRFLEVVKLVLEETALAIVLMSTDTQALRQALALCKGRNPLLYRAEKKNAEEMGRLAAEFKVPIAAYSPDFDELPSLTKILTGLGADNIILESGAKSLSGKLWDITQIRRQALKKSNRSLGYPCIAVIDNNDPYDEILEAATFITEYAGIVLVNGIEPWQALSLLTLRQNIYTDPQKPLQIEPKVYPIGNVSRTSPVLVTTNFSLSYYTVLGEVEASKIPSYIISVDTEGMSVLTAWAAEKFTPEKIKSSIDKFNISESVSHKRIIIPGYVAMMSGDLEEKSGWEVIVGPKEAAGIPSFLKNL